MSGGGFRVSIPGNVRKTIQNIKEIARNHSDDEIYAMLKECSMDPNETAQKLLLQDTFHEVKRKRDKKKENVNSNEAADSKWKPVTQGRGGRGTKGSSTSRHVSNDTGGGKIPSSGKDYMTKEEKGPSSVSSISLETEKKAPDLSSSPSSGMANGLINAKYENALPRHASSEVTASATFNKAGSQLYKPANVKNTTPETGREPRQLSSNLDVPSSVSGLYSLASDPVLVPSLESRAPSAVGTIKREVRSQRISGERNNHVSREVAEADMTSSLKTVPADSGDLFMQGKEPIKSPTVERNQFMDASHIASTSSHSGPSSRPSSNYSTRSQQIIGPQKVVGPSKEWKPKLMNSTVVQSSGSLATLDVPPVVDELNSSSILATSAEAIEGTTLKLQKKLENVHISDENVIIPNHLHVPEAERSAFSFGSFDANFGVNTSLDNGQDSEKSSSLHSELSQGIEENHEGPLSGQNMSITLQDGDYQDHQESPSHMPDNLSAEEENGQSGISPESDYDQSKPDRLPSGGPQPSMVQTTPGYSSFGMVPPMVGSQFASLDTSESQARDASRLPSFVVQQPFDFSSSYYTQMYRPGADGDDRFSPFLAAPGATTKYNGSVAVLAPQTNQPPQQEGGNPLILSTGCPTPLVTQPPGILQSSIPLTQQPVPVFRQPAGVHISHYPPNYIPFNQYFSPFYVPPPPIHHFLSNPAFPQQPPAGSVYPSPAGATTAVKYSLSQYKPGTNTGNQTHILPSGYGLYGSTPTGYTTSPAVATGNSSGNEDLGGSQYKENSGFMAGQQTEGSTVWVPTPGRDLSGLQTSSFYNLPPQGQHMTFTPSQAGHSSFAGMYHPAQSVGAATAHPLLQQSQTVAGAVEMAGPPSGVYQQAQRAQINWGNNY